MTQDATGEVGPEATEWLELVEQALHGLHHALNNRIGSLSALVELHHLGDLPTDGSGFETLAADIKRLGYQDGVEFCRTLPDRAGVVAIPTAIFYDHPETARSHVRFAFCKQPEVLTEALNRLATLTR